MPGLLIAVAIVPFIYLVSPIAHVLGNLSWAQVNGVFADPEFKAAFATSFISACISTTLALLFGIPTAFFLAGRQFFGKTLLEAVLLLPLVLPPVVGGIGLLSIYGPRTAVGSVFAAIGVPLTNSFIGVILAQVFITSPFIILTAKSGFEEIPGELKEAAAMQGVGTWHIFWYICIPLAKSAIMSGALLTFARAVGEFGATMMMAYHPYTLPVDIWVQFTSGGLTDIEPISGVIIGIVVVVTICGTFFRTVASRKRQKHAD